MLPSNQTPDQVEPYKQGAFDAYISYCALGGLITEDDGHVARMSLVEFCSNYGVTRMTLGRWKKQTPNWADRVATRRNEIMPLSRVTNVWNHMYLLSLQSQDKRAAVDAGKVILGHNGLQLPVQRQDIKVHGGLADVLQAAMQEGIIEGEVVDPTATDAGTSG